ncbi:MAG TPA: hypothetical protein VK879_05590 [Candidatus Sulfomarinibacteraceae bacterium]|nr:hypothetical protein [Candidatus Sulfomarinibacteraceae bacterium]
MFRNKKVLLLAALILVVAIALVAPSASAHPEEECHFWFGLGFSHTIEEGETLCFYSNFLGATPGLLHNLIQGAHIEVSIFDAAGNPVVQNELGDWGPIQKTDPALFDWVECPMPTVAHARWEYSPDELHLDAGSYTVWFDAVIERPVVDGLHMCDDPPLGSPDVSTPEDSVSFPVLLTVEPAE